MRVKPDCFFMNDKSFDKAVKPTTPPGGVTSNDWVPRTGRSAWVRSVGISMLINDFGESRQIPGPVQIKLRPNARRRDEPVAVFSAWRPAAPRHRA
jgi:hypothetical protein